MSQTKNKSYRSLSEREQQILDKFLNDIRLGRKDPVYFAEKILGIKLHKGQKHWLYETTKPERKKNILVPGNRFGKTFVTGVKHIWLNYYKIGIVGDYETVGNTFYQTLNLASHSEQAMAMPKMMEQILRSQFVYYYEGAWRTNKCKIPDFLPKDGIIKSPSLNFRFANNTKFTSRTSGDDRAGAVQGTSFFFISYDECCRSYKLEEEIEPDILPRLYDTGGTLDLLSTPDKDSPSLQYYYELCEMGKERVNGWYTQEGKTSENIFISEEKHREGAKSITDPETKKQVLEGTFIFSGGRMFSGYSIRKIWDKEMVWDKLPISLLVKTEISGKLYNPSHRYIMGCDFARSESGDATVVYVLDTSCNPYEIVSGYRCQGIPIMTQLSDLKAIKRYYNSRMIIDRNGLGGRILEDLLAGERPEAFDFKGKEKGDMLFILKNIISQHRLKAPVPTLDNTLYYLRRELGAYKEEDTKLSTDTVMALGMALYPLEIAPPAKITPIRLFRKLPFTA